MKRFLQCFFAFLLAFFLFVVAVLSYSDYTARSQTAGWFKFITNTKTTLEKSLLANEAIKAYDFSNEDFKIKRGLVQSNGTIIMQGGLDNQVIVLIPTIQNNTVKWSCIGGSKEAVPFACRPQNSNN